MYLLSGDKEFKIGTYKTDSNGLFKFDYPLAVKIPENPIFKLIIDADPIMYPVDDKTCYIQLDLVPPGNGLEITVSDGPRREKVRPGEIGDHYQGEVAHF